MKIQPVKGMADFYPEDQEIIDYIRNKWLTLGNSFGFKNYEGPILEPMELYLEKTSEEIVREQTFVVKDRKGKDLVMRPELTPTLARMVVQKEFELNLPLRWQSFGRFFRYEKPQKGRSRAFYQWNVDLMGEDSLMADLEILEIAVNSLRVLGLTPNQVKIRYSNRRLIQEILIDRFNLTADQIPAVLRAADRIDKVPLEFSLDTLGNIGIDNSRAAKILDFFHGTDFPADDEWLETIQAYARQIDIADYLVFDTSIIRGFDYYTGLVFEAWAESSLKRALFGGGRYDNLTKLLGGKRDLPGVGFAVGDVAMIEVLREFELLGTMESNKKILLIPLCEKAYLKCKNLAVALRQEGLTAQMENDWNRKIQKSLKYGSLEGFDYVLIMGDTEISENKVKFKDMKSREERILDFDRACGIIGSYENRPDN
jgi:histidyl-tRNA synthetase